MLVSHDFFQIVQVFIDIKRGFATPYEQKVENA